MSWKLIVWLAVLTQLVASAISAGHPLVSPDEARHAGIAYDMLASRQYLVPRINGLPVLDGAPLYYWSTLGPMLLLGPSEWGLRLISALAAALLLAVVVRQFRPWPRHRIGMLAIGLFFLQPGVLLGSRYATPDMLNELLLVLSIAAFRHAAAELEEGSRAHRSVAGGAICAGLLGLGAGPLSVLLPLLIVLIWLSVCRRMDLAWQLCRSPAIALAIILPLPWLWLVNERHPGIAMGFITRQLEALTGGGSYEWANASVASGWAWMLAGSLPLLICLLRFRDPARRRALRTPLAGLMATWLAIVLPLHPIMTLSAAGHVLAPLVPLLYFASLALRPRGKDAPLKILRAWAPGIVMSVAITVGGIALLSERSSQIVPLTQRMAERYDPRTDKVIMLDGFYYEFNFYMRSPKLVYVSADWVLPGNGHPPSWMGDLTRAAAFAPDTAKRLLLSASPVGSRHDLHEKLCERRVVNLWLIGSIDAAEKHPILSDLTRYVTAGGNRAWFLPAGGDPLRCHALTPTH